MKHDRGIGLHNVTLIRTPGLPVRDPTLAHYKPRFSKDAKMTILLLRSMEERPMTISSISATSGLTFQTIYKCLLNLRNSGMVSYEGKDRYTRLWSLTTLGTKERDYWLRGIHQDFKLKDS
jgi:hypothetical protein